MNVQGSREVSAISNAAFTLLETLCMIVALAIFTLLLAGVSKPFWTGKEIDGPAKAHPGASAPPAEASVK